MAAPLNDVAIERLDPQPVVSIRSTIMVSELGQSMGERFQTLADFLRARGLQAAGPPYVRYHTFGDSETDFEAGIPVSAPVEGTGRVQSGELPGGTAVTTWHPGSHDTLGEAYRRIADALDAPGRAAAGPAWEVYYWLDPSTAHNPSSFPAPGEWRTQLVQPITQAEPRHIETEDRA